MSSTFTIRKILPLSSDLGRENYTDEQLLALIRQREDQQAFEQLFHRYYPSLCKQAFLMVQCRCQAEEVVSDVFIRVWKNRRNLYINRKVRYYLHTAVRNQAIDYLRKTVKERPFRSELSRDYQSRYRNPAEEVISKEIQEEVQAAIDRLPPRGRYIFRLCKDQGMKYREIAEMLDISIKTVETHMRRSLIYLRQELRQP